MTLIDKTPEAQTDTIEFELELAHSPEKVWRAITDPQLVSQWLLPVATLETEAGTSFRFNAPPQPDWDGLVSCRVLEVEAQRRLSYTWEAAGLDTVVTFTVAPDGTGTRLTLVHGGFKPDQKRNFGGARYGWKMMVRRLEELLPALSDSGA